jgi:hypothetical protein
MNPAFSSFAFLLHSIGSMGADRQQRWTAAITSSSHRLSCTDLLAHYSLQRWPTDTSSQSTSSAALLALRLQFEASPIALSTPTSEVEVRVVRHPCAPAIEEQRTLNQERGLDVGALMW